MPAEIQIRALEEGGGLSSRPGQTQGDRNDRCSGSGQVRTFGTFKDSRPPPLGMPDISEKIGYRRLIDEIGHSEPAVAGGPTGGDDVFEIVLGMPDGSYIVLQPSDASQITEMVILMMIYAGAPFPPIPSPPRS